MTNQLYTFRWGNNPERARLKGRLCRLLARGTFNSALVEFVGGEQVVISRNAIRKAENIGTPTKGEEGS